MRALVVSELGVAPSVQDVPEPTRKPGEALLQVVAAPLNPVDLAVASGRFFAGSPPVPYVPGAEAVGLVLESERFSPATAVWTGMQGLSVDRDGTFAERVVAREDGLVRVPGGADPALAASLGIAGLAAWLPLSWRAPVREGDRVLVLGATGTLGLVAVQAAKILGAARVVAAGRDPERLERARSAGADAIVSLGVEDLAGALKEACGGDGPTLVLDPVWGEPLVAALHAAAPGARIVQIGQSAGPDASVPSGAVRGKMLELLGYTNLRVPHESLAHGYEELVAHAAAGRITLDLERVPIEQGADAWARQAAGADTKLVLIPS
jgi:NADPH2:quinone reductase